MPAITTALPASIARYALVESGTPARYAYSRLAVVEITEGRSANDIGRIAPGGPVARIVETWERLPAGGITERSARGRALAEAGDLLTQLEAEACATALGEFADGLRDSIVGF